MHARWMIVALMAGALVLGPMGASSGRLCAEESATTTTTEQAPALPDAQTAVPSGQAPVSSDAQTAAPSGRGEEDAVESRVVSSPPVSLSSSWWGAVEQAERWKLAGNVALLNGQPVTAYPFYDRLARIFPGTPHGRVGASRGNYALYRLRHAGNYPPEEDLLREIYDFFIW